MDFPRERYFSYEKTCAGGEGGGEGEAERLVAWWQDIIDGKVKRPVLFLLLLFLLPLLLFFFLFVFLLLLLRLNHPLHYRSNPRTTACLAPSHRSSIKPSPRPGGPGTFSSSSSSSSSSSHSPTHLPTFQPLSLLLLYSPTHPIKRSLLLIPIVAFFLHQCCLQLVPDEEEEKLRAAAGVEEKEGKEDEPPTKAAAAKKNE